MTDDAVVAVPQLTVADRDAEPNRERLCERATALPDRVDLTWTRRVNRLVAALSKKFF